MKYKIILTALLAGSFYMANAQDAKPEDTEIVKQVTGLAAREKW